MIKSHYSCTELAAMKLPGLPSSDRGIKFHAESKNWSFVEIPSRGRAGVRREYQPPKEIMNVIRGQLIDTAIKTTSTTTQDNVSKTQYNVVSTQEIVSPTALKDWQREIAEARAAICGEVKRLSKIGGTERAIRMVIDMAATGTLPNHLQHLVPVANAKAGENRALSRTSIYRWLNDQDKGIAALAPKDREKQSVPDWAPFLLGLYSQPQKPSLVYCMEQLPKALPAGIAMPSYDAASRFIKKMSNVDAKRGRMGTRELRNIQPFVRRDTSKMWPGDAYTADGHTFDAEVAHPAHGKPFRPEITTVLDIATRKLVGWSAGLAESTWTVVDAHRHAVVTHGIEAIFYVDNGSGFKNEANADISIGFMARLGITLTHSLPYRSQARGLEERSHRSILVRAAKQLPTYIGKDMDAEAKQKVFKITRSDISKTGTSNLLMSWESFLKFIEQQVQEYNSRPHSGLPKIRDEATGKKRHQTPNEAWQEAVNEGWSAVSIESDEANDLFRPYKEAKTTRGEIRLFNNVYFDKALADYHGEQVRVGYDIHDASQVWVRNLAGQLICVAGFEANKRSYFPESFIQQASEKRAAGRIKRAQAKIDEAQEELDAPLLIEQQPVFEMPRMAINTPRDNRLPSTPDVQIVENGLSGVVVELPTAAARPMFNTQASKYRWLLGNPHQINLEDERWLDYYRITDEYKELFDDREVAIR